jgi:nucleoside-diphosphate-sugar epimerase
MMHSIDVIGGSGFIGTRLVGRLIKNCKVSNLLIFDKVLSNTFSDFSRLGDVRSIDDLRSKLSEQSVIINLAAEHRDDVRPLRLYDDVNVGGARNICTVATEKNVRMIIFTSSVAVYGFAQIGTNESGEIAPFNDYGRTKYEAEQIFKVWQSDAPDERVLVIIRPTVVFGEQNRGNVYNLLRQIASRMFVMVGHGENRKSMAYVENIAAFIEYSMSFKPGVHIYNFIDKPDFTMNNLFANVNRILGRPEKISFRLPIAAGYLIGKVFDLVAAITGKRFSISSIRIRKFCANSVYNTAIDKTGFVPPVPLEIALAQTVRHEFIEKHDNEPLYFTE